MKRKGILCLLICLSLVACSSKARKAREVQEAIERLNREHEQMAQKRRSQRPSGQRGRATASATALADAIVARVNDEVIFLSDLDEAVEETLQKMGMRNPIGAMDKRELRKARSAVLEQLIERKLLEQEAARRGIQISDEAVEEAVEAYLRSKGLTKEQLYLRLARERIPIERFKERFRKELRVARLLNREIRDHIHVSEEQIRAYYESHRDKYHKPGRVRIQQIVLLTRGYLPRDKREKRQQISDIREKILVGEDFAKLAREFSEGPNAEKGGDCGYFQQGELMEELERVAFSIPVGEVSPIIETSVGFHLIRVLERTPGESTPLEEVRDEIKAKLEGEIFRKQTRDLVERLRKSAYIDVRL
jgi:parvulin-like peptidyl-prolyl isomerase